MTYTTTELARRQTGRGNNHAPGETPVDISGTARKTPGTADLLVGPA